MQGQFDIIVIGSGLGGLECGAMLAREGMGVCVAEQAALPGGCLQSFSRRGHAIDTGMHYIGSMQAGGIMRRYFEYFGILGSLRLRPLDEAFDVVSLPGAGDYAYMHGYEAFEKHLGEWFPHEKAGLGRYCAKLREIGGSIGIGVHRTGRLSDGGTKYLGAPAAGFIGECVADPLLRNVLAGTNPLYGGVRESSTLYHHAMVNHSNIEGACRFTGGTQQIADALAAKIREHGGTMLVRSRVVALHTEGRRITGVELADGRMLRAKTVISAIHPAETFRLIGPTPVIRKAFRERIGSLPDSLDRAADTLTVAQRKALLKEAARKAKAEKKAAAAKIKKAQLDSIAVRRKEKTTAKLLLQKEREEARLAARRLKAASKLKARQARAARKGKVIPVDSAALRELDSLIEMNMAEQDSLLNLLADSLLSDTTAMALPADSVDSLALPRDSIYRLMKGYRDVRIFRSDFQTVCDSIVAISTDSTIHLYIDPVLWNQSNQITSDVMDIFTERQQIKRAEFIGSPMMASQLDTTHYNQVAGKTMTAYFYNNQIYRNDVNGNAQTIYYMQDGEPPEITMMGVIESGDCSFYIEDKQVVQITYRTEPVYNFYPMDDIPPTQDLYLKGFKWEGARRPVQADVFDRRIRPSQRKERTRLRHPDFPIMMRIEEHKKRLIEQRRWADRNDQVDPLTVEWMRELGYEVGQPREPQRPAPQAE